MIEKLLTVTNSFTGKKNTNYIQIKGDWLKKYGFDLGDFVKVKVTTNQIIIEKNVNTILLKRMGEKNPALLSMIENLGMTTE